MRKRPRHHWLIALASLTTLACSPKLELGSCERENASTNDVGIVVGTELDSCTPEPTGDLIVNIDGLGEKYSVRVGGQLVERDGAQLRLPLALALADSPLAAVTLGSGGGASSPPSVSKTKFEILDGDDVAGEQRLLIDFKAGSIPGRAIAESLRLHPLDGDAPSEPPSALIARQREGGLLVIGAPATLREVDRLVIEDNMPEKLRKCGPYALDTGDAPVPGSGRYLDVPEIESKLRVYDARTGQLLETEQLTTTQACPSNLSLVEDSQEHSQVLRVSDQQLEAWYARGPS